MKALYGLGNHNIYHVQRTLKAHKKDLRLQTLGFEDELKPKAEVVLVPTVSHFLKNRKALNASDAIVIIFDTPVLLEYLKPIQVLDVKKIASFRYVFTPLHKEVLLSKLDSEGSVTVEQETVDVIPRLLNSTFPSIMKPILTFLYSVPNTDKRILYRYHILKFLVNHKVSLKDLKRKLIQLSTKNKLAEPHKQLLEFLETEHVTNARTILSAVRKAKKEGKVANVNKLCEQYKVSTFDIKYVNKAYQADKRAFVIYNEGKTTEEVFSEYHEKKAAIKAKK